MVHVHVNVKPVFSYRESGIQRGMSLVTMVHFHMNVKPAVTEKVEFQEGWSLGHQASCPYKGEAKSCRQKWRG